MASRSAGTRVLAVDLGSTHFKAALFDADGRRRADASVPVPYLHQDGSRFEMDPAKTQAALETLENLVRQKAGVRPEEIGTVAYDSQAQTFCLLDARDRPLTPLISWLDRRADRESRELARRFGGDFHRHCGFAHPADLMLLSKLLWFRRQAPERLARAVKIASLPGFAALPRLGGRLVCDRNLAAMSGVYSLAEGDWWEDALAYCGIDPRALGELVEPGQRLGAAGGPALVLAGNDQTAGAYGNGCRRGELVLTLGTALVAYRFAGDRPGPFSETGVWGPYPGGGFYELATRSNGCLALDWARKVLAPEASPAEFDRLAETGAGNARVDDPLFFPERAHRETAWSATADLRKMAYAVLEGIAFSLRQLVQEEMAPPHGPVRYRVIGGGSRSDPWMGIVADVLGAPTRRGGGDSLLGAAAMGAGFRPGRGEEKTFSPRPDRRDRIEARYAAWRERSG